MTSSKVTFFRNAAVVTIPAEGSNIIIPARDGINAVFGTFRANGCKGNLTQLIPDTSATIIDPFEALIFVGARAIGLSGSEGTVTTYHKDTGTVVLSLPNNKFEEVALDDLEIVEFVEGFGFSEFANAVRLGGSPLLAERVAGEGTYTYAMKADGFELTYDVDLSQASGKYLANLSASSVMKFPSCVDLTADVEIISKEYRLPVERVFTKSRGEMGTRSLAVASFDGMMESAEIDPNLDALSIKGGELELTANRRKKYSLGNLSAEPFEAMFTQRLELPVSWTLQGYREMGAPDSSVTLRIPEDGPGAVKLPQGQATVSLAGSMLGTCPVDATYPGQSVVLALLKNEALEGEVFVESVGRQYSISGGKGKVAITTTVRSNIVVTFKAPGMSADAPACDFQVILRNVPNGAQIFGDTAGCEYDVAKRTIEIKRSIIGHQTITVRLTVLSITNHPLNSCWILKTIRSNF